MGTADGSGTGSAVGCWGIGVGMADMVGDEVKAMHVSFRNSATKSVDMSSERLA
jgi:hypothetical protein